MNLLAEAAEADRALKAKHRAIWASGNVAVGGDRRFRLGRRPRLLLTGAEHLSTIFTPV